MDLAETTNLYIRHITNDTDTIAGFVKIGIPKIDAIANLVALSADQHFKDVESIGNVAQGLSDWNQYLRGRCSDQFEQYSEEFPYSDRYEINAIDEMVVLNGIRRGIKHAMGYNYHRSLGTGKNKADASEFPIFGASTK
jgi:hypothetical protein